MSWQAFVVLLIIVVFVFLVPPRIPLRVVLRLLNEVVSCVLMRTIGINPREERIRSSYIEQITEMKRILEELRGLIITAKKICDEKEVIKLLALYRRGQEQLLGIQRDFSLFEIERHLYTQDPLPPRIDTFPTQWAEDRSVVLDKGLDEGYVPKFDGQGCMTFVKDENATEWTAEKEQELDDRLNRLF